MLRVENLKKIYQKGKNEIQVFRDLNLEVQPGEMLAVRGPSGCGKTTLLLIAGGLLHPTAGSVYFKGDDIYAKKPEARAALRAHQFGFIFQQYHLIPYLSVLENILLPEMTMHGRDYYDRACDLMEKLGLSHRSKHIPAELSAGEKQRTALARAILHSPDMLFADEITGNLDEQNAEIVMKTLKNCADEGKTVLYVTHDVHAASVADRIVDIEGDPPVSEITPLDSFKMEIQ